MVIRIELRRRHGRRRLDNLLRYDTRHALWRKEREENYDYRKVCSRTTWISDHIKFFEWMSYTDIRYIIAKLVSVKPWFGGPTSLWCWNYVSTSWLVGQTWSNWVDQQICVTGHKHVVFCSEQCIEAPKYILFDLLQFLLWALARKGTIFLPFKI